jgi:chemotaxis protein MotB
MSDDHANPWTEGQEESYYISIADMLVGLLFLFIIMLMYSALQLRTTTQDLATAEDTRNDLLRRIATYMREHNVSAEADVAVGVLRLPDEILFEKGRDEPKADGEASLRILADALSINLPCYAFEVAPRPVACGDIRHNVEAIFIEGHTDSDPIAPTARIRDNWDLSSSRASNTFRILNAYQPALAGFLNAPAGENDSRPLMSVAGYADQRPIDSGSTEAAKSRNRRIDLRFVMASPKLLDGDAQEARVPASGR